jgi:hypothetical protein
LVPLQPAPQYSHDEGVFLELNLDLPEALKYKIWNLTDLDLDMTCREALELYLPVVQAEIRNERN